MSNQILQVIYFLSGNHNQQHQNKKNVSRFSKTTFVLISSLCLIAVIGMTGCGKTNQNENKGGRGRQGGVVPVEIKVIKPQLLLNTVSSTGTILANEKAELRPEISGRITQILFEEGTVVPKGKLLVKMNDSDLQAQLKRNEAQGILLASDEFQKRKLLEIKAISRDEYDVAKSALLVNQADKQLLQAQIDKTEIHAPFNGVVGLRTVSVGNYVASNTLIATIQQINPVKIEFEVPEKYSGFIQSGLEIKFETDLSDSVFLAKVYAIESSITKDTRTLVVRALCPNTKNLLKPGSFARVNMILQKFPEALTIPSEAILTVLDGNNVILLKNGKARIVPVKTGIRTDSDIQITSGIAENDTLIVTGLLQLTDGMPVKAIVK